MHARDAADHPRSLDARREFGRRGEDDALCYLQGIGFRLVARNHRTSFGEVDLIVVDDRVLVFAEVKARHVRAGYEGVYESELGWPSAKQRMRLRAAARAWLLEASADRPRRPELRFDAVRVLFDQKDMLVDIVHREGI
ncbi:MAG TPA: YraN family protein [Solirubrobacteraceae bacterium]|nr:YraN family protein [Solirubrobacteraceae bacterium]